MPDWLNVGLWILQVVVALLFLLAGVGHTIQYERSRAKLAWISAVPKPAVNAIGVLELLAAVGVVAPMATGILPWLTPLAALGLALLMLGAIPFHIKRKEPKNAGIVAFQAVLALGVFVGRWPLLAALLGR